MYYQKESKSIDTDYYNTYAGYVNKDTDTSDMLTTIIKILAIVFLLTLIIFGYIFVSNQYYLSQAPESIELPQKVSIEEEKVIIGVNTIESVASSIISKEDKKLSSEDVTKIVQMVMVKMTSLNEQEEKAQKVAKNVAVESEKVVSEKSDDIKKVVVEDTTKAKNSEIDSSSTKIVISESTSVSENVKFIVVKKGDTLSTIASRVYGDTTAYSKIRDANLEIIKDTNKIFAGQRLRIPI